MDGLHISEFFLISIHFNILQPGHPCFFLVYSCLFCIPDELKTTMPKSPSEVVLQTITEQK